ncbi:MAG: hypothetical protein DELT_02616 [Desulfovibrio sp.]
MPPLEPEQQEGEEAAAEDEAEDAEEEGGAMLGMGTAPKIESSATPLYQTDRIPAPASRVYTNDELALDEHVRDEMQVSLQRSLEKGLEQGGWIYEKADGTLGVQHWDIDDQCTLTSIRAPFPDKPDGTVGVFHTHPGVTNLEDAWPSHYDAYVGKRFGVPGLIQTPIMDEPKLAPWGILPAPPFVTK